MAIINELSTMNIAICKDTPNALGSLVVLVSVQHIVVADPHILSVIPAASDPDSLCCSIMTEQSFSSFA